MKRILLIVTVIYTSVLQAQILNIDRIIQYKTGFQEAKNFYATIGADFNLISEGNTMVMFSSSTELTYLSHKSAFIWLTKQDFSNANRAEVVNTGYSQFVYRYQFRKRIVPELLVQYQWNGPLGMVSRYLGGGNMRFNLYSDSTSQLLLKTGLIYEWEEWKYTSAGETHPAYFINENLKLNIYLKYMYKISDSFDFTVASYLQASPDKNIVYPRISPIMVLNFKITKKLSMEINAQMAYDTKPFIPIDKLQYRISNKLKIIL